LAFAVALLFLAGLAGLYVAYLPPPWFLHLFARNYPDVLFDVRTEKPLIALTIDDAPHPDITPAILDVLRRYDAKVTFFVIGEQAAAYPDLLRDLKDAGHEIANHMYTDRRSAGLPSPRFVDEMLRTQDLLEPLGASRWLRPGAGVVNQRVIDLMLDHDFVPTLGSAYPLDLRLPEILASKQFLLAARPGAILVLHDGPDRTKTPHILERVLPILQKQGYSFVSLTELVAAGRG
jgi:peptidoglycan/xylan/chitin deacetylase (PgdA/CDA1 family)